MSKRILLALAAAALLYAAVPALANGWGNGNRHGGHHAAAKAASVCAIRQCRVTHRHRKASQPRYRRHYRRSVKPWARHVRFRHWPRLRIRHRRHRGGG